MKTFTIKVYDKTGATYLGNLPDTSDYSFTKTINGGLGPLQITLPRPIDEYNKDGLLSLLNTVEVWVQDIDAPSGTQIYSGYIESIEAYADGSGEMVTVWCIGFVAQLYYTMYRSGTTIAINHNSADPRDIFEDIIDKFRVVATNSPVNYTVSSTEAVGSTITYSYNSKMCGDAIDLTNNKASADWWWYVGADNVATFKSKPSTPTHTFTMGRDIVSVKKELNFDDMVNSFYFWNSKQVSDPDYLSTRYYNAASISSYVEKDEFYTDGRVTSSDTANALGDAYVNAKKDPNEIITLVIKDSNYGIGYDIESIEPGDTCKIVNVASGTFFSDNMSITKVEYRPDYVTLYLEDLRTLTSRKLTEIRRRLTEIQQWDGAPTVTETTV